MGRTKMRTFLGEVLRGDRIVNTPYEVRMAEDISCRILCNMTWRPEQHNLISSRISHDYYVHLLVYFWERFGYTIAFTVTFNL